MVQKFAGLNYSLLYNLKAVLCLGFHLACLSLTNQNLSSETITFIHCSGLLNDQEKQIYLEQTTQDKICI